VPKYQKITLSFHNKVALSGNLLQLRSHGACLNSDCLYPNLSTLKIRGHFPTYPTLYNLFVSTMSLSKQKKNLLKCLNSIKVCILNGFVYANFVNITMRQHGVYAVAAPLHSGTSDRSMAVRASEFAHEIFTRLERCTVPLTAQDSNLISQKFTLSIKGSLPVQKQVRLRDHFLHIRDEMKESCCCC
jgi:hypothetical protein